jgi:hypothetical protein
MVTVGTKDLTFCGYNYLSKHQDNFFKIHDDLNVTVTIVLSEKKKKTSGRGKLSKIFKNLQTSELGTVPVSNEKCIYMNYSY